MSALDATTPADAGDKKPRRRRTPGPRPDGAAKEAAPVREKKPRPESIAVPAAMVGTTQTGRVTTVVKKGRLKFGFIHIGAADADEATLPRIYFSFTDVTDADCIIRNKDLVQFAVKKDEKERTFAAAITLTAAGKTAHDAKEAELAVAKAAREAAGGAAAVPRERKERAPRERKPQEERNVFLRCTCEGVAGEQRLEINCAASVGKAKNVATIAFDAPLTHNVFHLTTAAPAGVFLTKVILSALQTDDRVHLRPATEAEAAAKPVPVPRT